MIDIDSLPDEVLTNILQRNGLDDSEDEEAIKALFKNMTVYQAMDAYLCWNGIHGYTGSIIKALDGIRDAEVKKKKQN
jgi:hypothetical protein